ncbi:hypothetical protein LEN26_019303 [Aphanomyces euteiches]|nr:hypothetical protein LEN26_019303 [Aphanomyces euteiches]KAH9109278.1 hypothetical protein AeMF1_015636 [Aphanomyces euteiches]KAH9181175.1 hypothetical protein AeNC1_016850 [Aphanomyces euteiches]
MTWQRGVQKPRIFQFIQLANPKSEESTGGQSTASISCHVDVGRLSFELDAVIASATSATAPLAAEETHVSLFGCWLWRFLPYSLNEFFPEVIPAQPAEVSKAG